MLCIPQLHRCIVGERFFSVLINNSRLRSHIVVVIYLAQLFIILTIARVEVYELLRHFRGLVYLIVVEVQLHLAHQYIFIRAIAGDRFVEVGNSLIVLLGTLVVFSGDDGIVGVFGSRLAQPGHNLCCGKIVAAVAEHGGILFLVPFVGTIDGYGLLNVVLRLVQVFLAIVDLGQLVPGV